MKKKDTRVGRSISFNPGLLAVLDRGCKARERSSAIVECVVKVREAGSFRFRPNAANVAQMEAGDKKAKKQGPSEIGSWVVSRSISFAPDELEWVDAHRAKLGMDRSRYLIACLEQEYGIRPHPELYEPMLRP